MPLFHYTDQPFRQLSKKKKITHYHLFFLMAHLNNKSSYKMHSCTKILISLTVTCSLAEISQVFHAELVNTDLWWVVILKGLIVQVSLMPISPQHYERQMILESDGGSGGLLKPQDTQLLEDRCRDWLKTLSKPAQSEITACNHLSHTVLREEDDVVRQDPSVQGELCEILLQILTGLWSASWNTKPAVVISESQCGCQGFEVVFMTGKLW